MSDKDAENEFWTFNVFAASMFGIRLVQDKINILEKYKEIRKEYEQVGKFIAEQRKSEKRIYKKLFNVKYK